MEKLVTSTHAGVKEEKNVAGKFCYVSNMEKLVTSTHAGVKEEKNVAGKFYYISNTEKLVPVLMLAFKRRKILLVSSVLYQIWKKLVTSTHAGVKEENNVAGKFCYM